MFQKGNCGCRSLQMILGAPNVILSMHQGVNKINQYSEVASTMILRIFQI